MTTTQTMTGWTGLREEEMQEHRGGFTLVEFALGIAAVVIGAVAVYFNAQSVAAQNAANDLELAKWKYDNDRMNLTENEMKLLGLTQGIPTVNTSNGPREVMWVSYGDPGAYPPAGMFISQSDWDRYRQSLGYDVGGGGLLN